MTGEAFGLVDLFLELDRHFWQAAGVSMLGKASLAIAGFIDLDCFVSLVLTPEEQQFAFASHLNLLGGPEAPELPRAQSPPY